MENIHLEHRNNAPVVSHIVIWDKTWNESKSVKALIENYKSELESFWRVLFEITPFETNWWIQNLKQYFLNEDQATFLMTLLRNSKEVVDFKLSLIKTFKKLKELQKPKTWMELVLDSMKFLETEVEKEKEKNLLLENKIKEEKPITDFWKAISQSKWTVLVWDWAKSVKEEWGINIWRNTALKWLRDNWYLTRDNKPMQQYMTQWLMELKEWMVVTDRKTIHTFTTVLTGKGQLYFTKKLKEYFNNEKELWKIL